MESEPSWSRQKSPWDEHNAAFTPNHCFKNGTRPFGTPPIEPAYVQSCSRMIVPNFRSAQPSTLSNGVREYRQSTAGVQHPPASVLAKPHVLHDIVGGVLRTWNRVTGFKLTRFMAGGEHCSPSREPEHKVAAPLGRAPSNQDQVSIWANGTVSGVSQRSNLWRMIPMGCLAGRQGSGMEAGEAINRCPCCMLCCRYCLPSCLGKGHHRSRVGHR